MKKRDEINAFLGKDTEFEGKLSFTGSVRIDGLFRGEIITQGILIVGETARIESDVHVSHMIISGEFRGHILADEKIEMHKPARVSGNIQAPLIIIEEGVIFEGNCRMRTGEEPDHKGLSPIG